MKNKIKLIWDFRGIDALKTALHHEIHLKEFINKIELSLNITGFETKNDIHTIAYMVVFKSDMIKIRDILKPHRAEVYLD